MNAIYRDSQEEDNENKGLKYSFKGMKCIGCPW